jgi:hypothetical protein
LSSLPHSPTRPPAAAEAFQAAQAKAEAARTEARAEAERRAAEQKEAQEKLREEQQAAAALADLMARAQQVRGPAA